MSGDSARASADIGKVVTAQSGFHQISQRDLTEKRALRIDAIKYAAVRALVAQLAVIGDRLSCADRRFHYSWQHALERGDALSIGEKPRTIAAHAGVVCSIADA
jgi:hypothetical protein